VCRRLRMHGAFGALPVAEVIRAAIEASDAVSSPGIAGRGLTAWWTPGAPRPTREHLWLRALIRPDVFLPQ
jgi:hypothetical protein